MPRQSGFDLAEADAPDPPQPPTLRRALALTLAQSPACSHSLRTIHEPPTQGTLGRAR